MKSGIYTGLSFAEYHAIPAVNHSKLEPFRRTPAHAREAMLHPKEGSEALQLGHAFHALVLEEPTFLAEYVVPPKVDRRTTVGKKVWAEFVAANPGKTLLDADEMSQFEHMRQSIMEHPTASEFVANSVARELTFLWDEEIDGEAIQCKGRVDILSLMGGWTWIVDLKTTRNASEKEFSKDVGNYGYARQGSWYRRGLCALKPAQRRYAFIAVEKDAPHCAAVHELDERALEQGDREMTALLKQYVSCNRSGLYPGYDPGMGLIDIPSWMVDVVE